MRRLKEEEKTVSLAQAFVMMVYGIERLGEAALVSGSTYG